MVIPSPKPDPADVYSRGVSCPIPIPRAIPEVGHASSSDRSLAPRRDRPRPIARARAAPRASSGEALTNTDSFHHCDEGEVIDSFGGEDIDCNPGETGRYPCVELADRYEHHVKHGKIIRDNAEAFCANARALGDHHVYNPDGKWGHRSEGHRPGTGDLLVWSDGSGPGHVAVVTTPADSTKDAIHYVQQTVGKYVDGRWEQVFHAETHWSSEKSFFEGPSTEGVPRARTATCWIHPE